MVLTWRNTLYGPWRWQPAVGFQGFMLAFSLMAPLVVVLCPEPQKSANVLFGRFWEHDMGG